MLFRNGQVLLAALYVLLTVTLGLASTYAGWRLARRLRPQDDPGISEDEDHG